MDYRDRLEAGRELARKLLSYKSCANVVVLALPRGGVPVGYEVARAIHAPLDVFLVRKLGVPGCEDLTMGAIASGNTLVVDPDTLKMFQVSRQALADTLRKEQAELLRKQRLYRGCCPALPVQGRTVIIVDDELS